MGIDMAWAAGLPQQMAIVDEPIAWYWLAIAAVLIGTLIGNSFTQGLKLWQSEHKHNEWLSSETRLFGRIWSAASTVVVWILITLMSGHSVSVIGVGLSLAFVSAGLAPHLWDCYEWGAPHLKKYILKKLGMGG